MFNTPAWDTWVAIFADKAAEPVARRYLLAYVPAHLKEVVAAGIDVNPEQCIEWLGESETELVRQLLEEQPELIQE